MFLPLYATDPGWWETFPWLSPYKQRFLTLDPFRSTLSNYFKINPLRGFLFYFWNYCQLLPTYLFVWLSSIHPMYSNELMKRMKFEKWKCRVSHDGSIQVLCSWDFIGSLQTMGDFKGSNFKWSRKLICRKEIHKHFQTTWTVFCVLGVGPQAPSTQTCSKWAVTEVEGTLFWHNYVHILFHLLQ